MMKNQEINGFFMMELKKNCCPTTASICQLYHIWFNSFNDSDFPLELRVCDKNLSFVFSVLIVVSLFNSLHASISSHAHVFYIHPFAWNEKRFSCVYIGAFSTTQWFTKLTNTQILILLSQHWHCIEISPRDRGFTENVTLKSYFQPNSS